MLTALFYCPPVTEEWLDPIGSQSSPHAFLQELGEGLLAVDKAVVLQPGLEALLLPYFGQPSHHTLIRIVLVAKHSVQISVCRVFEPLP